MKAQLDFHSYKQLSPHQVLIRSGESKLSFLAQFTEINLYLPGSLTEHETSNRSPTYTGLTELMKDEPGGSVSTNKS